MIKSRRARLALQKAVTTTNLCQEVVTEHVPRAGFMAFPADTIDHPHPLTFPFSTDAGFADVQQKIRQNSILIDGLYWVKMPVFQDPMSGGPRICGGLRPMMCAHAVIIVTKNDFGNPRLVKSRCAPDDLVIPTGLSMLSELMYSPIAAELEVL